MLCAVGLGTQTIWAERLTGLPVSHWAAVPSLPAKPGEHRLRSILATVSPRGQEVSLAAARTVSDPRSVNPTLYRALTPVPEGSHVLLIDDTWVSGGHAQSAALALRAAGAARISVFTVGRWLDKGSGASQFIREELAHDYDPTVCPWTGSRCP
jgi:hypothetical protein